MSFPWKLVTIDIDGTLTTIHGWEWLARSTGRLPQFEVANRRYLSGEVGENPHLQELLDLATGLRREELYAILASTPRISGIREAVALLHERGCTVALLTHNPSYVCEWYEREFGFDDHEGTDGSRFEDGRVAPAKEVRTDKIAGMRLLLERHQVRAEQALHAGDGPPDAAVFPTVGGGVALNSRWPKVKAAADADLETNDLRDLVPVVERLSPRPIG